MGNLTFVITSLTYGGAETQLVLVALKLKARGWDVSVISITPPKAFVRELESVGIPVESIGIQKKLPDPRSIFRLVRLIWTWQPDIIHSFMVHANLFARLIRPLAGVPVLICSARNTNEEGRLREVLYRLTDPLCNLTTQVSQAGLKRYVRIRAVPKHRIRYIPNGVDTERFRPNRSTRSRLREELGLQNAFVWLAVGRFSPQKNYPLMLRAFAHGPQKQSETVLLIVGEGLLQQGMEALAKDLGVKDLVRFLGIRRDVPELMNASDGYIMSSSWEGMANVLLEASAMGLPIVATDVGGNREVVHDGETGFLVPSKNPEALATAMVRLMELSEEERRQMGEVGRQYIEANYSLEHVVDMWEALYIEFLNKKRVKLRNTSMILW